MPCPTVCMVTARECPKTLYARCSKKARAHQIGTKKGVEHLTDKGVTFEVWRSSQWHEDSELKVTVEDPGYYSGEDAYGGKWQTDVP